MIQSLTKLKNGKNAKIIALKGGIGLNKNLESLNIRTGKQITKITSHPFSGPIIVNVENRAIAIGRGMAEKIFVEEI